MGIDLYQGLDLNLDKIQHTQRAQTSLALLLTLPHAELEVIKAAANGATVQLLCFSPVNQQCSDGGVV